MLSFNNLPVPAEGEKIEIREGRLHVPNRPIIPFIEGDGTGRDIWRAASRVFNAAVEKAYRGERRVVWYEVFAGEKAYNKFGEWLPRDTVEAIREFTVAIKGPLTTPVGGGIRSLNVTLRQVLDLYACVRPVRWYPGVPGPPGPPDCPAPDRAADQRDGREDYPDLSGPFVYHWGEARRDSQRVRWRT